MIPASEKPILIAGAPRSGTSIVAGIVAKAGVWSGSCYSQEEFQPKGYFENIPITCCTWHVARARYHWSHKMTGSLPALTPDIKRDLLERWRALIPAALWSDGYEGGVWMYKLPQLVWFWPVWMELYPNAQWVTVHRTKEKIASSMARNWGGKTREWFRMARLYMEGLEELKESVNSVVAVKANTVAKGDASFLKKLEGVTLLHRTEVREFIVEDRWHG